jgi:hypothetical protein
VLADGGDGGNGCFRHDLGRFPGALGA